MSKELAESKVRSSSDLEYDLQQFLGLNCSDRKLFEPLLREEYTECNLYSPDPMLWGSLTGIIVLCWLVFKLSKKRIK